MGKARVEYKRWSEIPQENLESRDGTHFSLHCCTNIEGLHRTAFSIYLCYIYLYSSSHLLFRSSRTPFKLPTKRWRLYFSSSSGRWYSSMVPSHCPIRPIPTAITTTIITTNITTIITKNITIRPRLATLVIRRYTTVWSTTARNSDSMHPNARPGRSASLASPKPPSASPASSTIGVSPATALRKRPAPRFPVTTARRNQRRKDRGSTTPSTSFRAATQSVSEERRVPRNH